VGPCGDYVGFSEPKKEKNTGLNVLNLEEKKKNSQSKKKKEKGDLGLYMTQ